MAPASRLRWRHALPAYLMLWFMLNQQFFGMFPWWHLSHLCFCTYVWYFWFTNSGVKVLKEPWTAALAALLFRSIPSTWNRCVTFRPRRTYLVTLFLLISFLSYSRFREEGARAV